MLARSDRGAAAAVQIAVALVLVAACGGGTSSASTSSPPSSSTPAHTRTSAPESGAAADPTLPACRNTNHLVCLTPADGGRTVSVPIGAHVLLELRAPDRTWSVPRQSGQQPLAPLVTPRREGGALRALYAAQHTGTSTLTASERPVCAPGRVCPLYIILWQVHVRVRG